MEFQKKHYIITGHYGSGKSNIAVNTAIKIKKTTEKPVYLIDADIVNPYFRSSDNKEILEKNNIILINPIYAGSNLDVPSLPPDIFGVFNKDCLAIWDIGGDDAGAIALGRYQGRITEQGYEMAYIVNAYRPLTETADEMLEFMKEIENVSRLKTSSIINNSNLGVETTPAIVLNSFGVLNDLSEKSGIPISYTSVSKELEAMEDFYLLEKSKYKISTIELYTKKYF
ncbi:MAG: hypothetical protein K0S55_1178 [Clostridia bacterium]|nr:hypothetical protein [Clostridia bacterium]